MMHDHGSDMSAHGDMSMHGNMSMHGDMSAHMEADMRRRFWVALVLTIPLAVFPLPNWMRFVLATPVVFWCGSIFLTGAVAALRTRSLDMDVLIATGVLTAYFASVYLTVIHYPASYYDAAAMLVTFVLFGHWMLMKSQRGTTRSEE